MARSTMEALSGFQNITWQGLSIRKGREESPWLDQRLIEFEGKPDKVAYIEGRYQIDDLPSDADTDNLLGGNDVGWY